MIVFTTVKRFSESTGEELGSRRIPHFEICDFTGEKIDEYSNPNAYEIIFCDNDPCFGNSEGERWLFDYINEKYGEDACYPTHELFGQMGYKFKTGENGVEVFGEMVEKALKEMEEGIYSLDHLLRWSRGRMLERLIKEGQYELQDFLEDDIQDFI